MARYRLGEEFSFKGHRYIAVDGDKCEECAFFSDSDLCASAPYCKYFEKNKEHCMYFKLIN